MATVPVGVCDCWAARSMEPGSSSVSCAYWRLLVVLVGVPCLRCSLAASVVLSFLRVTHGSSAAHVQSPVGSEHILYLFGDLQVHGILE